MATPKFSTTKMKSAATFVKKSGFLENAKKAVTPKYNTSSYDKATAAYEQKMKADAAVAKQKKAAEYDEQARQAYVSRIQNENKLSQNLAAAGIRGGASETSRLNLQTNYETNRNKIASEKASGLQAIDMDTNDKIFQYRQTIEADKRADVRAREAEARQIAERKRQEKWNAAQSAKQNKETRYAATVSGYTNNKTIDRLIKKIKKSGKDTWRISYLRAQKAVNKAKKKKKK